MAKAFDLRKQLKLHDNQLLKQLFRNVPVMAGVAWDEMKPRDVEIIVAAWEAMGDDRRHYQVVLQDVHELSDPKGHKVLIEELEWQCPERLEEFAGLKSPADKALWAYLETRNAFDQAAIFARAEALRTGGLANRWNSLPKKPITSTPKLKAALEAEIRAFYWNKELRGEVCEVHHYQRLGGADFFFAYLPDWPDKQLIFDEEHNLAPREESYAFSNVFVYSPSDGAIDLIAKGGKKVRLPLRRAFCRAVFGIEVDDDEPLRASYKLDQLLDPAFAFATMPEDMLASVRLRRLRIVPRVSVPSLEYVELKFSEHASRADTLTVINQQLAALGVERSQISATQASIQLLFIGEGEKKGKKMTFSVSLPNTCDISTKPDDVRVVGERCIQRWRIVND